MPSRIPAAALLCLLVTATLAGCIVAPDESSDELAERYAREETQRIDEQAFEQARERSRVQRGARQRARIASAPPLDIDPALTGRWQFGSIAHPLNGTRVCAALSGIGEPAPAPGAPAPRLLLLADAAFVTSDVPLASEGTESVVRVDSGLPIPLDVLPRDEHVATLRSAQDRLFETLRGGSLASIEVTVLSPADEGDGADEETVMSITDAEEDKATTGMADRSAARASVVVERVIGLDALAPMLDELERC